MPPMAAMIGTSACLGDDNSPTISSRFNSRPMMKKNIAISASLIQW